MEKINGTQNHVEASPEQLGSSEEEFVMDSSNCLLVI